MPPRRTSLHTTTLERCFLPTRHVFVFAESMGWCYRARSSTSEADRARWKQLHGERFCRMVRTTVSPLVGPRFPVRSRAAGPRCTNIAAKSNAVGRRKFARSKRRCTGRCCRALSPSSEPHLAVPSLQACAMSDERPRLRPSRETEPWRRSPPHAEARK